MNYDSTIMKTNFRLANFFSKKYGVCTNSFNSCIIAALNCLNLSNKYILVNSEEIYYILKKTNYQPVFVNYKDYKFDIDDFLKKVRKLKSYCLILSHNNGNIDTDKILYHCIKHNIFIIDDYKKVYNKNVKMIGELSCFSLEEGSLLCAQEGGLIITDISRFYEKLINLVGYVDKKEIYNYSFRISKLQCNYLLQNLDK